MVFYFLFWIALSVSILDFRGKETTIKATTPISKTIILIDTSSSMFAEDVKPNRLKKAAMLARHFVKRHGAGDIGVLVFSDTTKKLVPFTDDRDLLDSRISALEDFPFENSGSNLHMAISESISYLASESDKNNVVGNIVVISDAESHEEFNIIGSTSKIKLAFVAVGTTKGSNIPIRDRNNVFRGYKEFEGKPVVTKINENFLKKLNNKFENYKYWVIYSFSLPTDEILEFMTTDGGDEQEGIVKQRPVLGHYFILASIVFYFLYTLFRSGKSFGLACVLFLIPHIVKADIEKSYLKKLENGGATETEKSNILAELIKDKKGKEAALLASEINTKNASTSTKLNIATAKLSANKIDEAIEDYSSEINEGLDEVERQKIRENLMTAINQNLEKKGKNQEKDKEKSEEEKKDQNQDQQKGGKGNSGKDNQDKKEQKDQEKDQEKNEDKDKNQNDEDKNEQEKKKNEQQKLTNKDKTDKTKKNKSQLAGLLEQLKSDDKQLQKKFIDTSAKERGSKGKDW